MRKGPKAGEELRAILGSPKKQNQEMCVCVCVHMCVEGRPASWRFREELSCSLNPNTVWRQSFFFLGHLSLLSLKTFN